jgi:hypothetical protein
MTNHAERVRDFYRKQGEQKANQELLYVITQNSSVTVDYLQFYLKSQLIIQPSEKE